MNRIQNIQKAKSYMEMLTQMIDPTNLEPIEESVLSKKDIRDTFIFISKLLEELISNNGEVVQVVEPAEFEPNVINKDLIEISSEPISVMSFVSRINRQVNTKVMKRMGYAKINNWLVEKGYLTTEQVKVVKQERKLEITNKSNQIGIISENKVDLKTGELKPTILFTAEAQNFILENLEDIFSS